MHVFEENLDSKLEFEIIIQSNDEIRLLCGSANSNLKIIEDILNIKINQHSNFFSLFGEQSQLNIAKNLLNYLHGLIVEGTYTQINSKLIHDFMQKSNLNEIKKKKSNTLNNLIKTPKISIMSKGVNQHKYILSINNNSLTFGIGSAGTGKTFLAIAAAVSFLLSKKVDKIILTRPLVEAGEKLGFLPGDISQKIDPYLHPMFDALHEMLDVKTIIKLQENNQLEISALAFMRGRTLNRCFVILDEAQNTTYQQMKMFLTRIGLDSKVVITGDISQIDLPKNIPSGLVSAIKIFENNKVEDSKFIFFNNNDVMRHKLVNSIIEIYDNYEKLKIKN